MLTDGNVRMGSTEEFGSVIEELLWKKIHIWGHLSDLVQQRRLLRRLGSHITAEGRCLQGGQFDPNEGSHWRER